jgi:hypothetical protein
MSQNDLKKLIHWRKVRIIIRETKNKVKKWFYFRIIFFINK